MSTTQLPRITNLCHKLTFIEDKGNLAKSFPPECQVIQLPKISDPRGNLSFIEGNNHIPFEIKRAYWIYDSPGGEIRGGRACQNLHEFVIAISGSFDIVLDNGYERKICSLNRSYFGLYIPPLTWRWLENFSSNSFALVLASQPYREKDYIRDYATFIRLKQENDYSR